MEDGMHVRSEAVGAYNTVRLVGNVTRQEQQQLRAARSPAVTRQATMALISNFEEVLINLRGGSPKAHHWEEVAKAIAESCPTPIDGAQCKSKIDNLKKKYKQEANGGTGEPNASTEKANAGTGEQPSTWPYFEAMTPPLWDPTWQLLVCSNLLIKTNFHQ